jgi:hypothetical protein
LREQIVIRDREGELESMGKQRIHDERIV